MLTRAALLCAAATLALPAPAGAGGGRYAFAGGTKTDRQTVVSALEASSFEWDLVPGTVVIRIARGTESRASPGVIWLDADLLAAGTFAWGVVQHEYAHQVDFLLLEDRQRARLLQLLGGSEWCYETQALAHAEYACERFASTLAWSYWPSPNNCMRPESPNDESAAMAPRLFKAVLESSLQPARFPRPTPLVPAPGAN